MKTGRKSKFEELQIVKRYADLAEPFFEALQNFLNSKDKNDRKFAIEQLSKAFPKMIPQEIGGIGGSPIQVQWIASSQFHTNQDSGQQPSTTPANAG